VDWAHLIDYLSRIDLPAVLAVADHDGLAFTFGQVDLHAFRRLGLMHLFAGQPDLGIDQGIGVQKVQLAVLCYS